MLDLVSAMLFILIALAVLFALVTGIGLLVARAFGQRADSADAVFTAFWVGWCAILVFLQLWNLLFPVNETALVILVLAGAAGLAANGRALLDGLRHGWRRKRLYWLVLAVVALWFTNRAIGSPYINYDTGLYHIQSMRWSQQYPIVPGLGNLHGRLAFNNAYFLYCAVLGVAPWGERVLNVAASLLYMAFFAQVIWASVRLFTRRDDWRYADILTVLAAPLVIERIQGTNTADFATDVPVMLLGLVLAIHLLRWFEAPPDDLRHTRYSAFVITLIACTGVSVKLSSVAFSGTAILLMGIVWLVRQPRPGLRTLLQTWLVPIGAAALVLVPWMVRGVILSGYIAYPNTLGALPVEWRVPRERAIKDTDGITHWAHFDDYAATTPYGTPWFRGWATRMLRLDGVRFSFAFGVAALFMLAERWGLSRRPRRTPLLWWTFLIPMLVALGFWLLTAPAYRFAAAPIWLLGTGAFVLALSEYEPSEHIPVMAVGLMLLFSVMWPVNLLNPNEPGSDHGFYPLPQATLKTVTIPPGLTVYVPTVTDQCWDAPLPCTPGVHPGLRLRDEDDLGAGFKIE